MNSITVAAHPLFFTGLEKECSFGQMPSLAEIASQEILSSIPAGLELLEVINQGKRYYYATLHGVAKYWWDGEEWLRLG